MNKYYLKIVLLMISCGFSASYATDSTNVTPPSVTQNVSPIVLDTGVSLANSTHTRVTISNRCPGNMTPYLVLSPMGNLKPGADYGVAEEHLYVESGTNYDWGVRNEWLGATPGTNWYWIHYYWIIFCK